MTTRRASWTGLLRGVAVAALVLAIGCNDETNEESRGGDQGTLPDAGAPPTDGAPAALSDPQILAIVLAVDAGAIAQAKLALARSSDTGVRGFADREIAEHGQEAALATQLLQQMQVPPQSSPLLEQLTVAGQQAFTQLAAIPDPAAFDLAYAQAQAQQHGAVLVLVNLQLIPQAQDPSLQAFLVDFVRSDFASHLLAATGIAQILAALGTRVTDAQAATFLDLSNQEGRAEALIASTKGVAPPVVAFANQMVAARDAATLQLRKVRTALDLHPSRDSVFIAPFVELTRQTSFLLKSAQQGPQFDRTYMDSQLTGNLLILTLLDDVFIPSAQSPVWAAFLQAVRAATEETLVVAEQINASLAGVPTTTTAQRPFVQPR
jgi:predicted outer membrane protein